MAQRPWRKLDAKFEQSVPEGTIAALPICLSTLPKTKDDVDLNDPTQQIHVLGVNNGDISANIAHSSAVMGIASLEDYGDIPVKTECSVSHRDKYNKYNFAEGSELPNIDMIIGDISDGGHHELKTSEGSVSFREASFAMMAAQVGSRLFFQTEGPDKRESEAALDKMKGLLGEFIQVGDEEAVRRKKRRELVAAVREVVAMSASLSDKAEGFLTLVQWDGLVYETDQKSKTVTRWDAHAASLMVADYVEHVEERGTGDNALVLLAGWLGDAASAHGLDYNKYPDGYSNRGSRAPQNDQEREQQRLKRSVVCTVAKGSIEKTISRGCLNAGVGRPVPSVSDDDLAETRDYIGVSAFADNMAITAGARDRQDTGSSINVPAALKKIKAGEGKLPARLYRGRSEGYEALEWLESILESEDLQSAYEDRVMGVRARLDELARYISADLKGGVGSHEQLIPASAAYCESFREVNALFEDIKNDHPELRLEENPIDYFVSNEIISDLKVYLDAITGGHQRRAKNDSWEYRLAVEAKNSLNRNEKDLPKLNEAVQIALIAQANLTPGVAKGRVSNFLSEHGDDAFKRGMAGLDERLAPPTLLLEDELLDIMKNTALGNDLSQGGIAVSELGVAITGQNLDLIMSQNDQGVEAVHEYAHCISLLLARRTDEPIIKSLILGQYLGSDLSSLPPEHPYQITNDEQLLGVAGIYLFNKSNRRARRDFCYRVLAEGDHTYNLVGRELVDIDDDIKLQRVTEKLNKDLANISDFADKDLSEGEQISLVENYIDGIDYEALASSHTMPPDIYNEGVRAIADQKEQRAAGKPALGPLRERPARPTSLEPNTTPEISSISRR